MRIAAALLVGLSMLAAPSPSSAGDEQAPAAAARINLVFKLDPRLAGGTYGGERWVSPPIYTGASGQDVVEAKATAVDAKGRPANPSIDWKPSEPEMVTVSPPRGQQVKIAVKRAGESNVTVTSGGVSRKLVVKAEDKNGVRQLTITQ